ncbi:peptidoglycan bridge formation glycyltransferase FemA/FemB family protein [Streptomyces cyaneochromogenes]|uniref:Peptidoglycan bridge formation glycyltransferase FemA/FemB family protein n=1 Tax=Streptomyces cyaneochromogenes TaxID=2496836 RepID=A0A3S9M4X6_9ACTN|nr:peptidoglycan bridge formation glycyltransferase FemA/FemB family protein [Streptomyces cyaneochromogenes]AZQ34261.1 peptidoglycan bridge formation glycyltransferase FemA/FemB family protein [Streptomyces cyaneochromogenes]
MTSLFVREIPRAEHLAQLRRYPDASHLQIPEWGDVKPDWLPESVGWFDGEEMIATALVLYRPLPGTRRYLAYLPDGPAIDWRAPRLEDWLDPLVAHLRRIGAFSVRIGPPLVVRHWDAATVAAGITDPGVRHLRDLPAAGIDGYALDVAERLRRLGWRRCAEDDGSGFGLGQPRYGCEIPLAGRSVDELRGALAPHWEQSLRTAEAAGVRVSWGSAADLPEFYRLYTATAAHDGFKARPPEYFGRMWKALNAEDDDRLRLYLAEYDGEVLSAALMINVGSRVWHSYAASGRRGRQLRPSSALLWRMLLDARAAGAETYDLRSITPSLTEDRLLGRLRFKTGTGGRAVEYLGEWELPVGSQGKVLQRALGVYLGRR